MIADCGLRDAQGVGRLSKAAGFLDFQEDFELADREIEHCSRMSDNAGVVTPQVFAPLLRLQGENYEIGE